MNNIILLPINHKFMLNVTNDRVQDDVAYTRFSRAFDNMNYNILTKHKLFGIDDSINFN